MIIDRNMTWPIVILLAVLAGYFTWRGVATAARMPKAGDEAPGFSLPDQSGVTRSLADFRGRILVLYFFPRADTPG